MNSTVLSSKQYYRNGLISVLIYFGLLTLIFAQYLTTAVPAYLALIIGLLLRGNIKLPRRIILYVSAVFFYSLVIFNYSTGKNIFAHLLFYFGFLFPLIVFFSDKRLNIRFFVNEKFVIGLCLITILEAILFNSPLAQHLYFFPIEGNDRVTMFGFYQRPMGLGGNPSLTSVVLFFLVALTEKIQGAIKVSTNVLVFVTTIFLMSGAGFGLLVVYLLILALRTSKSSMKHLTLRVLYLGVFVLVLAVSFGYIGGDNVDTYDKFSINYFLLMYYYKVYIFKSVMKNIVPEVFLLGKQIYSGSVSTTGDAGFIMVLSTMGLLGAGILLLVPLLYHKALWRNLVPTMFFYLSFTHYTGLLSPPGQVLLAAYVWLLAQTKRQIRKIPPDPRESI